MRREAWGAVVIVLQAVALTACGNEREETSPSTLEILPGNGIGAVRLGMTYGELSEAYGEMPAPIVDDRVAIGGYPERGLDIILTSPQNTELTPDAIVIAVGATAEGFVGFPRPGLTREEVESSMGKAPIVVDTIEFYEAGVSVKYRTSTEGDVVKAVGVYPAFTHIPTPPEMQAAGGR